jgi:hypothetical protein
MKHFYLLLFWVIACRTVQAQSLIFDPGHLQTVMENGAYREAAENTHQHALRVINQRLSDINLDISAVVLVQKIIQTSLATVNTTLKDGLAVRQIFDITAEITRQCSQAINLSKDDPALLLFSQQQSGQLKIRALNLLNEVSSFILKEGNQILMDYEKRDFLLRKVIMELQVMRALSYSMQRSAYWASRNSLLKSINPCQNFIAQDARLADGILLQHQFLKP